MIQVGDRVKVVRSNFEKSDFTGAQGTVTNVCQRFAGALVPITVAFDEPVAGFKETFFGFEELVVIK